MTGCDDADPALVQEARDAADLLHRLHPPPANPGDGGGSNTVNSFDPNGKTANAGFGAEHFVAAEDTLGYRVDFENDPAATAPAQRVDVLDRLSASLDWNTLEFTEAAFGDTIIAIPPGSQYFHTTVDVSQNDQDLQVVVDLDFNSATGEIRASFQSLDPATGLPPNVLAGFLPPEDDTGRGQGHIGFTVRPAGGLASGTQIRNVALIRFDFQEMIATNQVDDHDPTQGTDPAKESLVTLDTGLPQSSVDPLPATTNTLDFTVSWSGADDQDGSGIAAFNVFVSDNGGPFQPFVTGTTDTSALFSGEFGHTYGFYTIAVDNVGQQETKTPTAETVTLLEQLPSASLSTPSSPASGDVSIDYILTDAESDTCSILAEFSSDGGATWSTATEVSGQGDGTTDLASSPSGVSHTFAWASGNDIVNTDISNVKFRITPSDANGTGTAGATDAFTIDNSATNPGPIISSIVVVTAKGLMTWNAQDSDGVASTALTVDGVVVSKIFGPYTAPSGVNYAGVFGSLPAGSHDYVITATDTLGNASQQTGSFDVVAAGPIISSVVVVAEKGLMTWNAQDSDGVASTALTVDGVVVSKIFGPYTAPSGVNYAGVFGSLPAGNHDYVITATDTLGNASQQTGSFDVVAAGPIISSVVVVAEKGLMTWNAQDSDGVASTALMVDGVVVSKIFGPYTAPSGVNYAGVFGSLPAGNHDYVITVTDTLGNASQQTGSFSISALTVEALTPPTGWPQSLTDRQLAPIVAEAERQWATVGGSKVLETMSGLTVQIADLPGKLLGEQVGKDILIDRDAAGYGWFVDLTPADDSEFPDLVGVHAMAANNNSPAANRADLLTAVMHELGHVLGYNHVNGDELMSAFIPLGIRRSLVADRAIVS